MSTHLRPTAPIAPRALLPGDPGRALALAQALLERPLMCNHHRGLWGYTGTTEAGSELTIQSTGIGGSSAAIVLGELARHGVRRAIRIGTCTALEGGPTLGSAIAAAGAIGVEGASRALGAEGVVEPDPELHGLLVAEGARAPAEAPIEAVIASVDVVAFADGIDGVPAIDMGTSTLFALGARLEVAVAGALVVAHARPGPQTLDDEPLEQASLALAKIAARALGG